MFNVDRVVPKALEAACGRDDVRAVSFFNPHMNIARHPPHRLTALFAFICLFVVILTHFSLPFQKHIIYGLL